LSNLKQQYNNINNQLKQENNKLQQLCLTNDKLNDEVNKYKRQQSLNNDFDAYHYDNENKNNSNNNTNNKIDNNNNYEIDEICLKLKYELDDLKKTKTSIRSSISKSNRKNYKIKRSKQIMERKIRRNTTMYK